MSSFLVTHYSPDLDSIVSVWLMLRFGGMEDAELEFVPAGSTFRNVPVDSVPSVVHLDTGLGRFDHHQEGPERPATCAAKLVAEACAPDDLALKRLVDVVNLVDNGLASFEQMVHPFSIVRLIRGLKILDPLDSAKVVQTVLPCLDAWYESAKEEVSFSQEFDKRKEFQTPWGLGISLATDTPAAAQVAYQRGAVVFVYQRTKGELGITASPASDVDLTEIHQLLQIRDPNADWYLHPSRKMLLCGSSKVGESGLSALRLDEIESMLLSDLTD